jgi:hypothetical protein
MSDFGRMVEAEIPRLRRYARALTRDISRASRADDLVQSCLTRAIAKQHLWQPGTNLRAWLFTILHNQHVSDVRRAAREVVTVSVEDAPTLTTQPNAYDVLRLRDLRRNANGGWKVLAPVMLEIDGRLLGPMVGTNLESGTATNGITMSEVLDRECRGVHFDVAARHGMGRAERFQSKPRVRAIVARGEPAHGREAHSDAQATRVTLGDR